MTSEVQLTAQAVRREERIAELLTELRFYADRRSHAGVGVSAVYRDGGRRAREAVGVCETCGGLGLAKTGLMIMDQDGQHLEWVQCPDCDGSGLGRG